jgi:hypothetical protein
MRLIGRSVVQVPAALQLPAHRTCLVSYLNGLIMQWGCVITDILLLIVRWLKSLTRIAATAERCECAAGAAAAVCDGRAGGIMAAAADGGGPPPLPVRLHLLRRLPAGRHAGEYFATQPACCLCRTACLGCSPCPCLLLLYSYTCALALWADEHSPQLSSIVISAKLHCHPDRRLANTVASLIRAKPKRGKAPTLAQ